MSEEGVTLGWRYQKEWHSPVLLPRHSDARPMLGKDSHVEELGGGRHEKNVVESEVCMSAWDK